MSVNNKKSVVSLDVQRALIQTAQTLYIFSFMRNKKVLFVDPEVQGCGTLALAEGAQYVGYVNQHFSRVKENEIVESGIENRVLPEAFFLQGELGLQQLFNIEFDIIVWLSSDRPLFEKRKLLSELSLLARGQINIFLGPEILPLVDETRGGSPAEPKKLTEKLIYDTAAIYFDDPLITDLSNYTQVLGKSLFPRKKNARIKGK